MFNATKYKENIIIKALLIFKNFNILALSELLTKFLSSKPFNENFNNPLKLILSY